MKKKTSIIVIILLLLTGIFIYQQDLIFLNKNENTSDVEVGLNTGNRAPDFTLQSLYGEEVKLSSLQGTKVLLNFWASWCGPCRSEMPDIEKLHNNHDDIKILAVNMREEKKNVMDFIMSSSYTFPILLDKNGAVADKYQVRGIPATYILNEEGIITAKHTGVMDYAKMKELLEIE